MASRATKLLRVIKSDDAQFKSAFAALCDRAVERSVAEKDVRKIIERVRGGGDEELLALVRADGLAFGLDIVGAVGGECLHDRRP